MRWLFISALMTLMTGCATKRGPDKLMLPITQVPKAVYNAAYLGKPGIRYHTAWKLPNGDYQLRGLDTQNANVDVFVSADGYVLSPGG